MAKESFANLRGEPLQASRGALASLRGEHLETPKNSAPTA